MHETAAERIERFLDEHPGVPLTVAVGFSSPNGIRGSLAELGIEGYGF